MFFKPLRSPTYIIYVNIFFFAFQLSCDLNPSPVTSGQGFDYATIRSRAEQNMMLSKAADQIKF